MHVNIAAHRTGHRHIFVTTEFGPFCRNRRDLTRCGALRPKQAALALGLFLRSRNDRTLIMMSGGSRFCEDTSSFYLTLGRARLAQMESFLQNCMLIRGELNSAVRRLAWSIVERTARACQARDQVLRCHLSDDSKTNIAYHFDYLTISLVGAWDSLAQVVGILYGIPTRSGRYPGFRRQWFSKALRENGGQVVVASIELDRNNAIIELLHYLRNAIHGPPYAQVIHDHELRFAVAAEVQERVTRSVTILGGGEDIGFVGKDQSSFQPAQVAEKIVELHCEAMCQVATQVSFSQIELDFPKRRLFEKNEFDIRRTEQVLALG